MYSGRFKPKLIKDSKDSHFHPSTKLKVFIGDHVLWENESGGNFQGVIRWVGNLEGPEHSDIFAGVEFEDGQFGNSDGVHEGVRYFRSSGIKVRFIPLDQLEIIGAGESDQHLPLIGSDIRSSSWSRSIPRATGTGHQSPKNSPGKNNGYLNSPRGSRDQLDIPGYIQTPINSLDLCQDEELEVEPVQNNAPEIVGRFKKNFSRDFVSSSDERFSVGQEVSWIQDGIRIDTGFVKWVGYYKNERTSKAIVDFRKKRMFPQPFELQPTFVALGCRPSHGNIVPVAELISSDMNSMEEQLKSQHKLPI